MRADQAIGGEAARDREEIDAARVPAEEPVARFLRPAAAGVVARRLVHEVEREQRPHAVVAEALPHLHREDDEEPAGMAEELALFHALPRRTDYAGTTLCIRSSTSSASMGMFAQRSSLPPLRTTMSFSRRTPKPS